MSAQSLTQAPAHARPHAPTHHPARPLPRAPAQPPPVRTMPSESDLLTL
ncbi:MAG: hypothetical protein LBQ31_02365 [Bacteroidales bacterium]|nr:hypothetical protein [Bacteroidales bacterium]